MIRVPEGQTEAAVEKVLRGARTDRSSLIGVLQAVNRELRYLPEAALRAVSSRLGVPLSEVYHVATFYKAFSLEPQGRHAIKICMGTACHVRGAPRILEEFSRRLGIAAGQTTDDGEFTLETVNCLGACAMGPIVTVDEEYFGSVTVDKIPEIIETFKDKPPAAKEQPPEAVEETPRKVAEGGGGAVVSVSTGTCGIARGAEGVVEAFREKIRLRADLSRKLRLRVTGCQGFCEKEPVVTIEPQGTFYADVKPEDVDGILDALESGTTCEKSLFRDPTSGRAIERQSDIPFYAGQKRIVFGDNSRVDPLSIDDYVGIGGYTALAKALKMSPEGVIEEVTRAGLRGRGGGGFPTGRKWKTCRKAHGEPKYVICNADEGDPGAYMDRSLLEGNPHRVIEGCLLYTSPSPRDGLLSRMPSSA